MFRCGWRGCVFLPFPQAAGIGAEEAWAAPLELGETGGGTRGGAVCAGFPTAAVEVVVVVLLLLLLLRSPGNGKVPGSCAFDFVFAADVGFGVFFGKSGTRGRWSGVAGWLAEVNRAVVSPFSTSRRRSSSTILVDGADLFTISRVSLLAKRMLLSPSCRET